jgi:hypothetical protein
MKAQWIALAAGAKPLLDQIIPAHSHLGIRPTFVGNKKPLLQKGGKRGVANGSGEKGIKEKKRNKKNRNIRISSHRK